MENLAKAMIRMPNMAFYLSWVLQQRIDKKRLANNIFIKHN